MWSGALTYTEANAWLGWPRDAQRFVQLREGEHNKGRLSLREDTPTNNVSSSRCPGDRWSPRGRSPYIYIITNKRSPCRTPDSVLWGGSLSLYCCMPSGAPKLREIDTIDLFICDKIKNTKKTKQNKINTITMLRLSTPFDSVGPAKFVNI